MSDERTTVWTLLIEEGINSHTYVFESEEEGKKFINTMKAVNPNWFKTFSGPFPSDDECNYGILRKIEIMNANEAFERFDFDYCWKDRHLEDMLEVLENDDEVEIYFRKLLEDLE